MPRARKKADPRQPELIDGVRASFPRFKFQRDGDVLHLWCPHCDGPFTVYESIMRSKSAYVTRSCPNCFKTARIPSPEEEGTYATVTS